MTDAQLFGLYASHKRGEGGIPEFDPLPDDAGPDLSPESIYKWYLRFCAGITDERKQHDLWKKESARRSKRAKKKKQGVR